jgi:hypothetical protein
VNDWAYGDDKLGKSDDDLVAHLVRASSAHAVKALELEIDPVPEAPMFAAIHAGSAIELLAKAALVRRTPLLLTVGQKLEMKSADAILRRVNAHDARTVDASVAKNVCGAFHGAVLANIDPLLRHRNSAAHMGLMARADTAAALNAMRAAAEQGIEFLGVGRGDYWRNFAGAVTVALDKHATAVEHVALSLIASHRATFESVELSDEEIRLRERRPGPLHWSETEEPHPCPSCANQARLGWSTHVDVEYEGPGECTWSRYLAPDGLRCPVCGLSLDAEQCESVGIDVEFDQSAEWTEVENEARRLEADAEAEARGWNDD